MEEWKTSKSHPEVEISSTGGIRSTKKIKPYFRGGSTHLIECEAQTGRSRFKRINLAVEILLAFVPRPKVGAGGLHPVYIDGDASNRALANLKWSTDWAYTKHKVRFWNRPDSQL